MIRKIECIALFCALSIAGSSIAAPKRPEKEIDTAPLTGSTQSKKLNDRLARMNGIKKLDLLAAGTYFKDYSANEVAADMKFKGKPFILNGRVSAISKDLFGSVFLAFHGDQYGLKSVRADLFEEQACGQKNSAQVCSAETRAAQLKKGDNVFLDCFGGGMLVNIPIATACLIRF